jgi:vacuolar iron transporter family protein
LEQRAKCEFTITDWKDTMLTNFRESYQATERRCKTLISSSPAAATQIIEDHFRQYGLSKETRHAISEKVKGSPQSMTCFLMRHYFDAAEPPDSRPYISALTLAISYFSGGFIPLIPYFAVAKNEVLTGLWVSIGIMVVVLLVFGYVKTGVVRGWRGRENIWAAVKGAIQMLIVGAVAAGAAVGLVRAINHGGYVSK